MNVVKMLVVILCGSIIIASIDTILGIKSEMFPSQFAKEIHQIVTLLIGSIYGLCLNKWFGLKF